MYFRSTTRFSHRNFVSRLASLRPELMVLEDRRAPGQTGLVDAVSLSLFGPALTAWQMNDVAANTAVVRPRPATTQSNAMAVLPETAQLEDVFVTPSKVKQPVQSTTAVTTQSGSTLSVATDLGAQAAQDAGQDVTIFDPRVTAFAPRKGQVHGDAAGDLVRPPQDGSGSRNTIVGPQVLGNTLAICPSGIGKMQSETAIAHSENTVVMAWNDSRGFPAGFGGCAPTYKLTGWAYSTDRGRTFTEGTPLPGNDRWGDPWLNTAPDGTFILTDLRVTGGGSLAGLYVTKGTPTGTGVNWGSPVLVGASDGPDRESMAIDPNNGNIYVSFTRFSGGSGIWLYRSTDGGSTFQGPVVVTSSSTTQGSAVAVGPSGEVYVSWANNSGTFHSPTGIGFARSLDGGQSFTVVGNIATNTGTFVNSTDRTPQFPQIAVDTSGGANDGDIYITYHSSHLGGGGNLHDSLLLRSTNGGLNWTGPTKINDDVGTAPQWFPTIDVDSFGYLHSFFYDRRGLSGTNTNLYYARSTNGGTSWESNVQATSTPFSMTYSGADAQPYYGDYINADVQGKSAMVSYADGRLGTSDTYFTRVGNRD